MTRNEILTQLYQSVRIERVISKMDPEHLREDLKQEAFRAVCELAESVLCNLHSRGELEYYMIGTITRMVKSYNSPFYKKYRRFDEKLKDGSGIIDSIMNGELDALGRYGGLIDPGAPPDLFDRYEPHLETAIGKLYWYEGELVRLYLTHGNSCLPIARKTGIPHRNVQVAIRSAKTNLKTILSQYAPE